MNTINTKNASAMNPLTVLSDTCMFCLGSCIGIVLNYFFENYVLTYQIEKRMHIFSIGILQIMMNALVIHVVRLKLENMGLFTLGLLTFQSLIVKKCII